MGNSKAGASKGRLLRVSENAYHNLEEITSYIAYVQHQPINAIRVGDKLFKTFTRIGKNPFMFSECEEIPTKTKIYRKAVCMSWLIIFRIKVTEIVIIGIVYGGRRLSRIKKMRKIK
jgi:plasmid stabilization system protein ParE